MSANDIINIIDEIPQYIKFIYPGYITLYVYSFLRANHVSDTPSTIFKSLALSYIYTLIIGKINPPSDLYENFLLIIISVLVAYFSYLITRSEHIKNILQTLEIETSFCGNEIEALESVNAGTWLVVYLNNDNVVYEGWLHNKELEEGKRQYISLRGFRKYMLKDDGKPNNPYIEEHDDELNEEVIIFYNDIKRIEKRDTNDKNT